MMRESSSMASTLAVPARNIACESARMILFIQRSLCPLSQPTLVFQRLGCNRQRQSPLLLYRRSNGNSDCRIVLTPLTRRDTLEHGPDCENTMVTISRKRLPPTETDFHENQRVCIQCVTLPPPLWDPAAYTKGI